MRKLKLLINGHTEYAIGIIALLFWILFALGGRYFGWATYPTGYFQKICFGIVGMSVIMGVSWVWIGATFPHLKELIDPDTYNYKMLSEWEQVKLGFWFYALYAAGAVLLASLY